MAEVFDTFNRNNGGLGSADSGQPWALLRGTVVVENNRGYALSGTPGGAFAAVDAGLGGQDAAVSAKLGGTNEWGQALYFRVVDVNNWFRVFNRRYAFQVSYTYTEYEWLGVYGSSGQPGSTNQHSHSPSETRKVWGPSQTSDPTPSSISHDHLTGSHIHTKTHSSLTGNSRTQTGFYTQYGNAVRLERCVAGTVTMLREQTGLAALSSLKAIFNGSSISIYSSASPTTPHFSITDSNHVSATKHGFGLGEPTVSGNSTGIDDFQVSPFNVPPNRATLATVASTLDRTQVNRLHHVFNDDNPGDSQSKADHRIRPAGTTTWTVNRTILGAGTFIDIPALDLAAGSYERQVLTYDRFGGAAIDWSAIGTFAMGDPPPGPIIANPANNGTVPQTVLLQWSSPKHEAYRVYTVPADGTAPNATYFDSGVVRGDAGRLDRSLEVPFSTNNRDELIKLEVETDGLWSPTVSVQVTVSYTPPQAPRIFFAPVFPAGGMAFRILNPTGAGVPQILENEIYVDEDGTGLKRYGVVPEGGTWEFYTPKAGKNFDIRVKAIAINGTSRFDDNLPLVSSGEADSSIWNANSFWFPTDPFVP